MKIKIIKGVCCNPWNLSALIGDEIEINDLQAKELIEAGRAVASKKAVEKPVEATIEAVEAPEIEAPKKTTKKAK
jgi:hypothetical protein